jgi:hypothetical protein
MSSPTSGMTPMTPQTPGSPSSAKVVRFAMTSIVHEISAKPIRRHSENSSPATPYDEQQKQFHAQLRNLSSQFY